MFISLHEARCRRADISHQHEDERVELVTQLGQALYFVILIFDGEAIS